MVKWSDRGWIPALNQVLLLALLGGRFALSAPNFPVCHTALQTASMSAPATTPWRKPVSSWVSWPVPGLYHSIPSDDFLEHKNWIFSTCHRDGSLLTNIVYEPPKTLLSRTQFASFKRAFMENKTHLSFEGASSRWNSVEKVPMPTFIKWPGVPEMVPHRGVPLQTFSTLHQMRQLGLPYGSLKKASVTNVENLATSLDLYLRVFLSQPQCFSFPQKCHDLVEKQFLSSPTGKYMQTVLTQSGHRIRSLKLVSFSMTPLYELLPRSRAMKETLLRQMGVDFEIDPQERFLLHLESNSVEWSVPLDALVPSFLHVEMDVEPWDLP